ncbi:anti-sigma factor [Lentibacillus sp.]|uniref:anti-sigma factor n=1 Tax=Lentibacillus sp. TaxID=1925746 RepID=UPI002B4B5715|nr:anti-sigma factor [Lentibacillus sp.]HLS10486.1 anti-sigma factor [Lentibacillus sp.]
MAFYKHIPEQKIIDFALGKLGEEERANVIHHTNQCPDCQGVLEEWQYMMSEVNEDKSVPSTALKDKLDKSIDEGNKPVKNNRRRKPVYWLGGLAAALLLTIGLTTLTDERTAMNEDVMYNEEINEAEIQTRPETKQLKIIPVSRFDHVSGNVWINDATRELLVEIDGLANMSGRNYQMWIVDTDDNVHGEVLPIQDGSVRVLYQGKDVNRFKLIKTSVEPAGGSEKPTGPETFSVDLPH